MKKIGTIERYQEFLPKIREDFIISLNEGNTPLILAESLPKIINKKNLKLYYKFEGLNPTGSFKDRGMTLAISKAFENGAKAVICASTGNTSASAAAYSSRCGLRCYVLIPEGKIAKGKLLQAYRYGAKVIMVKGNFDQALQIAKELSKNEGIELVNSINPYRIEGQKTASYEIIDDLGEAPDYHVLPVGNAGNITAYWRGYKEYNSIGKSKKLPKMLGFQAEGSAPLVKNKIIDKPETIATAIRIGNPASWNGAITARNESGGLIDSVSDLEITYAYKFLAEKEGIFAEPASAASVAGVIKLANNGYFKEESIIVMTLTGSGLKDPDFALSFDDKIEVVDANYNSVKSILKG
ncbi:threonine synthase [Candidatus Pacearchaeota archaeon]|nr:threonine synthase [Candidatus Pacearchaeota archaeon]